MSRFLLWAVLGGMLLFAGEARSKPLEPNDKWIINFADNKCEAIRSFGSPKKPVHFIIKPSPTSGVVQIALVRAGHKYTAVQEEVKLRLGEGEAIKTSQLRYGTPKQDVHLINLDAETAIKLNKASFLSWIGSGTDDQLVLGEMTKVMKTLADCRDDLRKYWNIEPSLASALREPPAALKPMERIFSTDDYPAIAVRNDESGTAAIVMLVDEKGQLADCTLDQTSGVPTLDAMTCIVISQRVKFRPAIGPDGRAVRGVLTTRIRWEMPL